MQVGAEAGNAVKSVTGMVMPGGHKDEKEGRKSDDHQDNKAAKDLHADMKKDPKRMEKAVGAQFLSWELSDTGNEQNMGRSAS